MTTNTNGNTPAVHPTADSINLMTKPALISLAVAHGVCASKTAARKHPIADLKTMLTHFFSVLMTDFVITDGPVFTPADAFVDDTVYGMEGERPMTYDESCEMPLTCDCDGECDDKYGDELSLPKPIAHGFANGAADRRGVRAAQARRKAKNRRKHARSL